MARPLRIEFPGAFYHVTTRGNERKEIYKSSKDRERFLFYIEVAAERYGAVIHTYCLMNNHYHLFLETPFGNLSKIMRHINGSYTTYFNARRKRSGHLFQGRYKAIVVDTDKYGKELSRYIHLNPVRAGAVSEAEEYSWSSYGYYIGNKSAPEWLKTDFILGYFDKKMIAARKKYKAFVDDVAGRAYSSPLKDVVGSTLLGSAAFVNEIKSKYLEERKRDRNIPALRALSDRPTIEEIASVVRGVGGDRDKLIRKMSIYFCHRYSGLRLRDIGEYFNIGESAVTQVSRRFATEATDDLDIEQKIKQVKRILDI